MEDNDIRKFQYYLLPTTTPPPEYVPLHDQIFDFWMKLWQDVFADLKYDSSHLHDDFIRQNVVSCICYEDQIIGALLFSFYSLDTKASVTFRYFHENYNDIFIQKLKSMNVRNVMAMQYLALHPQWRGKKDRRLIHPGLALVGLANKVRDDHNMDAGIGLARIDHKVNEVCYSFGADCIVSNVVSHNAPCDLIATIRGRTRPHPKSEVQLAHDYLWDHRIDLLKSVTTATQPRKSA